MILGAKSNFLPSFIVIFFSIISCDNESTVSGNYLKINGFAQGSTFNIIYDDQRDLSSEINAVLTDFDKELSTYDTQSFISKINNSKDSCFSLNDHEWFETCFHYAEFFYHETIGKFNPSIYPLVDYWGFYSNTNPRIDTNYIRDSILPLLVLEQSFSLIDSGEYSYICKTNKHAKLDFNAIAQGFSVDVISDLLESKNIQNYMVEIGGEIRVRGLNHKGELWKIGIERPIDSSHIGEYGFQRIVNLDNQALATSGNYRKFKTINGNRVSHTLNPLTGYPANNNLLSVSVITDKASTADALATSFMVMGKTKSIAYLNELETAQFQVYMIYDSLGEYKEWSNY